MGVDTSGKLTLTINRADPGSTFVHTPGSVSLPIGTWFHVGCVLQTKWDANTYQVCSLYNGVCTLGLSYAKSIFSSGMGSICQMGGNFGSTSYLTGSITNFRVSSSPTVYQNPWGTRLSYTTVFPLAVLAPTSVLLQGSPVANVASMNTVTLLSLFPITMMSTLLSNVPTSFPGAYNMSAGYMGPISATPSIATGFTFECWVNFTGAANVFLLDTLPPGAGTGAVNGRIVFYIVNSVLLTYCYPTLQGIALSGTITTNSWNHIACVWNPGTGTLTGYVNGVAGTPRSTSLTSSGTGHTFGIDSTAPGTFSPARIYQPLLRNRVVYTSNFTPSIDLTPAWNDTSVVYFIGASFQDLVTGATVPTSGNVVSTYRALA